ncbi:hypothetical protein P6U16_22585 (plasmid) [Rhizobium sp. 32-5/1]|uniref:hypothetical protein n=1 Tax=Rhizobium sp. 32-5/1 TaxID=3019602 RepID=UPI00240E1F38|nr:hypothetical protein [Rhizobium sp. 32-5/1]WEZ85808.1 hypothetical protein P6U16_22585 [Rhizobium sp. 32-5/1]
MGLEILNADNILFVPASEKSHRLLIVFSAANSRNFTFYNSCAGLQTNMLFIRDPHFNHWFQNGFIKNRTIDDSILFLRELCSEYDYISTFGSSMGGYAALLFGEKLNADRIIAIGPQTTLNHSYSRSPRSNVVLRYPNLSCLEPYCPKSRILIFVGMLDGVDLLNSIKIDNATGMDFLHL